MEERNRRVRSGGHSRLSNMPRSLRQMRKCLPQTMPNPGTLRCQGRGGRLGDGQNRIFLLPKPQLAGTFSAMSATMSGRFHGFATALISGAQAHGSLSQSLVGTCGWLDDERRSEKSPFFSYSRHGHGLYDRRAPAGREIWHLLGDLAGRRRADRADASLSLPTRRGALRRESAAKRKTREPGGSPPI